MPPVTRPVPNSTTDAVLETQLFWVKYRLQILAVLIGLVVVGAIYGGYRVYTSRRDDAAAAALASAKSAADYQKVIADYPSAPTAGSAYLLLAETQRKEQKVVDANATLKAFTDKHPKHPLAAMARMAMAGNLESLGKTDEALEMYRRLAADNPRNFNAPFALLAQVHLLKQAGKPDEARRVCETVLTQYRESYAATEATRYLQSLKPTPPANPAAQPSAAAAASPAP